MNRLKLVQNHWILDKPQNVEVKGFFMRRFWGECFEKLNLCAKFEMILQAYSMGMP